MASAAESQVVVLFYNTHNLLPKRIALEELGHLHPPTPIKTDNTTALELVTKTIKKTTNESDGHKIPLDS